MARFRVYKIEKFDNSVEYMVFNETFITSPDISGCCTFESFLPRGHKYYQDVFANDENEAIGLAQDRPRGCWLWSRFNWGLRQDELLPVFDLWSILPSDGLYIAQIDTQLNISFQKALNIMVNALKQKSCFSMS